MFEEIIFLCVYYSRSNSGFFARPPYKRQNAQTDCAEEPGDDATHDDTKGATYTEDDLYTEGAESGESNARGEKKRRTIEYSSNGNDEHDERAKTE